VTRLRQRVNRNVSAERQAIGIVVPAIVACRSSWLKIVQIADSATKPVLGHTNASCSTGLRPPLGWFPGRPRGHDSSRLRSEMVLIMAMKRVIKSVHVIPMGMANAGRMLFAGDVCMNIMGLGDPIGLESSRVVGNPPRQTGSQEILDTLRPDSRRHPLIPPADGYRRKRSCRPWAWL